MSKRARKKRPAEATIGRRKEIRLFEELCYDNNSPVSVELDVLNSLEAVKKKEKRNKFRKGEDNSLKLKAVRKEVEDWNERSLSDSMKRMMKEIDEAECQELVIDRPSRNLFKGSRNEELIAEQKPKHLNPVKKLSPDWLQMLDSSEEEPVVQNNRKCLPRGSSLRKSRPDWLKMIDSSEEKPFTHRSRTSAPRPDWIKMIDSSEEELFARKSRTSPSRPDWLKMNDSFEGKPSSHESRTNASRPDCLKMANSPQGKSMPHKNKASSSHSPSPDPRDLFWMLSSPEKDSTALLEKNKENLYSIAANVSMLDVNRENSFGATEDRLVDAVLASPEIKWLQGLNFKADDSVRNEKNMLRKKGSMAPSKLSSQPLSLGRQVIPSRTTLVSEKPCCSSQMVRTDILRHTNVLSCPLYKSVPIGTASQKRRRSEKTGLIKIEPVLEKPQLQRICEDSEDSLIELASDLADMSFDPVLISTPLQRVFKEIDRSAEEIRRSREESLEENKSSNNESSCRKDQSVQTIPSPSFRKLSMVSGSVTIHPREQFLERLSVACMPNRMSLKRKSASLSSYEKELLDFCKQTKVLTWAGVQKTFHLDFSGAVKLGEGSFGEVFKCRLGQESIALKVVPIGGEDQKTFADVTPEAVVSDALQSLNQEAKNMTNGFIRFPGAFVVKGRYPAPLLKAWNAYDGECINESPKIFKGKQIYVLLAYEVGGIDLEFFKPLNVLQAYSIVYQVSCALAVAERTLEFEHRDLHCGNILVDTTDAKFRIEKLNGREIKIRTYGVEVKIIDFTLSRLRDGDHIIYYDLNEDMDVFNSEGPLHCEYYRHMRKFSNDDWKAFTPQTNSLWTSYVVYFLYNILTAENIGTNNEREDFRLRFRELEDGEQLYSFLQKEAGYDPAILEY